MRVRMTPVTQEFELETIPEYEGKRATVTVRQARADETISENDLFSEQTRIYERGDERIQLKSEFNPYKLIRHRAWLTLCGSNLEDEATGKAIFRFRTGANNIPVLDMTKTEFERVWGNLTQDVVLEIYGCILELNPQWDTRKGSDEGEA